MRLAGGDGNAIVGLVGLVFGVYLGIIFIKNGYTLGRNYSTYTMPGLLMPLLMFALLLLLIFKPSLPTGVPFSVKKVPARSTR